MGILYADTINNNTPYKYTGQKIYATNPCGEQPLPPYGSCNLGSINLSHDYFYSENGEFDYEKLKYVSKFATRFLDNVGSSTKFPTQQLADWYADNRPIGLGIMGLADAMLRLKIKYGTKDGLDFTNNVMQTIFQSSYEESKVLGEERGVPTNCILVGDVTGHYRRNITTISIAPTGSIAFIAECSHGIEPIFSPSFIRVDERGEEYTFIHPLAKEEYFVSAIGSSSPTWKEQIDLVATVQKWCDSGISKTINLEENITPQEVYDAYFYAWKSECKGITVYRNNSRMVQVLNHVEVPEVKEEDSIDASCPTGVCTL